MGLQRGVTLFFKRGYKSGFLGYAWRVGKIPLFQKYPRFLITVYSMHYQENVSFLVKKFCESGKCRKFPEKNNRIAGLRCEYFIKNRVKKHFS